MDLDRCEPCCQSRLRVCQFLLFFFDLVDTFIFFIHGFPDCFHTLMLLPNLNQRQMIESANQGRFQIHVEVFQDQSQNAGQEDERYHKTAPPCVTSPAKNKITNVLIHQFDKSLVRLEVYLPYVGNSNNDIRKAIIDRKQNSCHP